MLASNPSSEHQFKNNDIVELINQSGEEFAPLNRLASYICDTPVSLVNLLDKNFQFTVSKFGEWNGQTIPKEETVCQFTVEEDDILIINDTHQDSRTNTIKELQENSSLRFYAGVPIKSPRGKKIGAFCVIDDTPKELTKRQIQALKDLGQEVEARITLLKQQKDMQFKNKKLQKAAAFLNNSTDILWEIDPATFKILRSEGADSILETSNTELIGVSLFDLIEEVNIQHHIKQWINEKNVHSKLGIPVKVNGHSGEEIWLNLTFSTYEESLLVTGRDITKRQLAEQQLKHSLEEKEILLSEVHHRVKNNLAVVNSLLQLERYQTEDEQIDTILLNSQSRIISIAKIHELLYQTNDFANVQLAPYLDELISHLGTSYPIQKRNIDIDLKVADFSINVNQALPLGLIINELITNAIKHAFTNRESGTITIQIVEQENQTIIVEIKDNGEGLDIDPADLQKEGSLGFTLVDTLIKQLDARLEIEQANGTTFRFTFQKNSKKGSVSAL